MLILRFVHLGELPCPLLGARLSRSCLPLEASVPWWPRLSQAQRDTRRNNNTDGGQVSSPGVRPCINYSSLPVCTGLGIPGAGMGALICTACRAPSGRRFLTVLCPICLCLSGGGECRIRGCVCSVPWDPGSVLLECCAGARARKQQGTDSLPGAPAGSRLQPFTRSAHSPWRTFPRAHFLH